MSDEIICNCGHSINSHSTHSITYGIHAGCQDASFCDCELTPQDVAAAELKRYETARQEDARRMEQVKGERDGIKRLAKDVNSLLNSTMTWMQEEGIIVPFVMTLMIGSLGEKSEKLAAALKDAK